MLKTDTEDIKQKVEEGERLDWDLEHCWSEPGPRGMSLKNRETFVPFRYVRKWQECNEERIQRALKRFKTLKLKVTFALEEHVEDLNRRRGKPPNPKEKPNKKFVGLVGKTIFIKQIPTPGMLWQIVKAMQDAAKEAAKK
jgi:hypothetical protein